MTSDRAVLGGLVAGVLASVVAVGYGVATHLVPAPAAPGIPLAELIVDATLVVVPFAVGGGATYLAIRHRIVAPIVLVAGLAVLPLPLGWGAEQALVGVLVVGPLVVVAGVAELLVRAHLGRLANPPTERGYRALSIGVMAAVVYFGVVTLRAVLPLWRLDAGSPGAFPPGVGLAVILWYVLGVSVVLVGLPVALNRRFGLLAPLVGLAAFLLVDLAFLQPLVAEGADLVVVLLVAVWPTLAALLAGVALLEWWFRDRRGEYDESDDGDGDGGDGEGEGDTEHENGFSLEGGLFGDRV